MAKFGDVIAQFATPTSSPRGMGSNGKYLWVGDGAVGKTYMLTRQGRVIKSFASPGTVIYDYAHDGRALWVADTSSKLIRVLDPHTGRVLRSFASVSTAPTGIATDGRVMWEIDVTLDIILCTTLLGQEIRRFATPDTIQIGICCGNGRLFSGASSGVTDSLQELDPSTGAVIRSARTPGTALQGIAYDNKYLWSQDSATLLIYKHFVD